MCKVSFCDRDSSRINNGRAGYCNFHYRKLLLGFDPEQVSLNPGGWRKHNFRHDYFSRIDTPEKAYVLGYFAADGCIENKYVISFVAHQKDMASLEFVRNELDAHSYPFKKNPTRDVYSLQVAHHQTVNDLECLGFGRRKSSCDTPFPDIAPHLFAPYILGIFDGDGSIWSNLPKRYKNPIWQISFSGTKSMLLGIRGVLHQLAGTNHDIKIKHKKSMCHELHYCGNTQIERIAHFLYSNNPPHYSLIRKKQRFQELLNRSDHAPQPGTLRTHCPAGHEYSESNTYIYDGQRSCRICRTEAMRQYRIRSHVGVIAK